MQALKHFHRGDVGKIYLVVAAGFLLLTASFYFFGFRPLTERLDTEHEQKIEHFLASGRWLLESALDRHISLVKQSASRTAIRKKQLAYLRGKASLDELVKFSTPKLRDAVYAEPEIVGITRYGPDGAYLYGAGLQASEALASQCDLPALWKIRQFKPSLIEGKRRLVYCAPISDKDFAQGFIGFDVMILEADSLQAVMDAGDASNISIMFLFVTELDQDILFQPAGGTGIPRAEALREHLQNGTRLPGYITRSQPLSDGQWRVHAVVNEKLFFADIHRQMMVLASVVVVVMVVIFILTVLALRPIIRTLLKEAELLEMSHRDGLTGLYNHTYVLEQLDRELARAQRSGQTVSVVMCDVDHFKQVNDTYGHPAGDEVLHKIALLIKRCIRTGDLAARYGGEEFMLILPDTDADGAFGCAERLRKMVAAETMRAGSARVVVTASLGIASSPSAGETLNWQALVKTADLALYESKHGGRNQTTLAQGMAADLPGPVRQAGAA